ncbi:hypothetical protein ACGRHY_29980 [Streptomyces sp. HK10]|uniref:hypothetical protein n=1 Tax=Streptomyces sp. HK10 TaxID=3373255 RepID=UPI003748C410
MKTTGARTRARKAASSRPGRPVRELVAAVAVDVDGGELVTDADAVPAPGGKTLRHLFAWLASGLPIGAERLHKDGRRANGTVAVSAAAARALRLPAALPDGAALAKLEKRLREAADGAGLSLGTTIGPRMRVYATTAPERGARVSLALVVVPWLAGAGQNAERRQTTDYTLRLADGPDGPDARTLARRLRAFTDDVGLPPLATAAVTSRDLVDALRPRETWGEDRRRVLRDGALPSGDTCVPVAAGKLHPLTLERMRAGEPLCEEEDYSWERRPTDAEAALPWAVAVDISASYLSVTETLRLPAGPLEHTAAPVWDEKTAGLWLCDFTGLETEDALPHPAESSGRPPAGPGWYATPTVAYMVREYGFDPATIREAYVSTRTEAFLRQWTTTIREAYKRRLAVLGLVDGIDGDAFLSAHAARQDTDGDPAKGDALALVAAYKDLYKKGVGRWMYYGGGMDPDDWLKTVVPHWSYRPEVRFHIIAAARIATHRRMRKTYRLTGRAPFAVKVDSLLYACEAPSPLPLIPRADDGRPVPGALRLGTAPGSVKHDKTIPMADVTEHDGRIVRLMEHYGPAGRMEKHDG